MTPHSYFYYGDVLLYFDGPDRWQECDIAQHLPRLREGRRGMINLWPPPVLEEERVTLVGIEWNILTFDSFSEILKAEI